MRNRKLLASITLAGAFSGSLGFSTAVFGHGDVTAQAVNTEGLSELSAEWEEFNPYREPYEKHALAVEVGASAYNQNCARCHGLQAISGGIAPDLRELEIGKFGDEWYKYRVINGAVRDGRVYMPKFDETLGQEALWAIRTYLESVSE